MSPVLYGEGSEGSSRHECVRKTKAVGNSGSQDLGALYYTPRDM